MRIAINSRSSWMSRSPTGTRLDAGKITQVRIHWPGYRKGSESDQGLSVRAPREHMINADATDRGKNMSMYKYSFYIPRDASVWEGRGWDFQQAATLGVNDISIAIQLECSWTHAPTQAQVEICRRLIAEADRRFGRVLDVYGHNGDGARTRTECPGPHLRASLPQLRQRPSASELSAPPATDGVPEPTLREGSSGVEARKLIDVLKFWKWYPAAHIGDRNDGKIGIRASAGIRAMQQALRVSVDHVYGPVTASAYRAFARTMADLSRGA